MSYSEHLTAGLAAAWDCTAIEAAERISPKRKRVSQEAGREDIPWTAARCNRLLRTITSRVNILRKQSKLCAAGLSVRNSQLGYRQDGRQRSPEDTPSSEEKIQSPTKDPQWIPGARLNAPGRTYSNRPRSQVKPAPRKADSGFSTPFVKRLLKDETPMANKFSSEVTGCHEFKRPPKRLRQLPVQLASRNEEAQRNLVAAFSSVLTATSEQTEPERIGTGSLISSCLRKVPHYIDLELQDINTGEANSEDVTSSIYIDLESLGTKSGAGWTGLREVVRSHCVHHICAAIEEDLVHESRILELINACSKSGALAEADRFLHTWLSRAQPGASDRMHDSYSALTNMTQLGSTHEASEMYLRQHTWLIDSDRVWISDVLRPGSTPLKDLIKALIRGPGQDVALAYLETAVVKDFETSNTSSLAIFTRLAGLLASIALTQTSSNTGVSTKLGLSAIIHRIAASILQTQSHPSTGSGIHDLDQADLARRGTIHPFVMADALLQLTSLPADHLTVYQPLNTAIAAIASQQPTFVRFTCNVAHHVFRFSDANELESLLLTTTGLLTPPPDCNSKEREILSRVAFEVAFAYSELTGIDIDHHFADKLASDEKTAASNITQTPRRRVQVSGFKWEEGLCEWVAATPLPASSGPSPRPDSPETDDPPKQLLTPIQTSPPKRNHPKKSVLVIPSSPDIIASQPASQSNPATPPHRPALKERSTNPQPPKQTALGTEKENEKTRIQLAPVQGKQVHLKIERAKKAALLAQAPPKTQPKRSLSAAGLEDDTRDSKGDIDELGVITPGRKMSKGVAVPRGARHSSVRTSLPARVCDADGFSDDELGM